MAAVKANSYYSTAEGRTRYMWPTIVALFPGRTIGGCTAHFYHLRDSELNITRLRKGNGNGGRPPVRYTNPHRPRETFKRKCLSCRRVFDSVDRKRNWLCPNCIGLSRSSGTWV
jgi:hypothetical protein